MSDDKDQRPHVTQDAPDKSGQSAESDAQGKVAPKDERSPEELKAEADLLKSSGGNPLTQEG